MCRRWTQTRQTVAANPALSLFLVTYFGAYALLYSWYAPIAAWNRLVLAQFIPLMFVVSLGLRKLLRWLRSRPLLHRRGHHHGGGLVCVPVGNAAHLVGQVVAVPVLNGDLDLLRKARRVLKVQHIAGLVAALSSPRGHPGSAG